MTHKGYEATVDFDEAAGVFHGEVVNTPHDAITFEGASVEELIRAFHDSVDEYLSLCKDNGVEPEQPLSTDFTVRIPKELRRKIMLEAKREAKSVDAFIAEALRLSLKV